jgi:hypothetical protein|tara:strand:+ start:460 stop:861 length:402 start_codon:yes stop_codon:yes gene_type:complete
VFDDIVPVVFLVALLLVKLPPPNPLEKPPPFSLPMMSFFCDNEKSLRKEDDGQKKRIIISRRRAMMVAIQREFRERESKREKEIYTTRKSTPFREMNPIQFHSYKKRIFFFSFSPFYLLLNQRRTFFDYSVNN